MDIDITSVLTSDSFVKLKCSICKNYLSHFPIHISGEKENICGRCHSSVQTNLVQNEVYETLAQLIQFPCRYNKEGCTFKALPKDIPVHEKNCDLITMKCRTSDFTGCDWEGAYSDIQTHCIDKHSNLILENGDFQLDLSRSNQQENLILHGPTLFLVCQKFYSINKLMEFSIYNFKSESNMQQLTCEVTFKATSRQVVVQCETTSFDEKKVTEIFLDSLKDRDNTSLLVTGKINLEKTTNQDSALMKKLKIDEELLSQLRCHMCNGYTLPPIYEQRAYPNRIQCSDCKDKEQVDNVFGSNIFGQAVPPEEIQNYTAGKLANVLNYPCKYDNSGCTFISKAPQMRIHQKFCIYGTLRCPISGYISCNWSGAGKDLTKHIQESHGSLILDSNKEISESLGAFNEAGFKVAQPRRFKQGPGFHPSSASNSNQTVFKCYLIHFANYFFLVNFGEKDNDYCWFVQMIGTVPSGFMFELEVIDKVNKHSGLISRQPCIYLKKKEELLLFKSCFFHKDQVVNLVSDKNITFKVQVYRKL